MRNIRDTANHSKVIKNTMKYNTNGWDTYRIFCFVEHLDTCQNISPMAIMYKDRLDRMNEFRKSNVRSSG